MAKADWVRLFGERIELAIEGLDEDGLSDDIKEAVDWQELVKEIIAEDPAIKKKFKDKVIRLVSDQVDEAESFEDLTGDDEFDFLQHLPGGDDIGTFVSGLLEQGQPLRKKLEEKVVELVGEQISNASDFEELTGDDEFSWFENLPDDFSLPKIVGELLASDQKLMDKLRDKLRDLIVDNIDEKMDSDDLPDWSDILEMLGVEDKIRHLAKEDDELKQKILSEIRTIIENKIENDLDKDSLPEDFWKKLNISAEATLVLADREFRDQISARLQTMIREFILNTVRSGDIGKELAQKVQGNQEFTNMLDRQVSEMMRNPELIAGIKKTIKERIESDPEVGRKIMNAVFEEVARGIVGKLFKSY